MTTPNSRKANLPKQFQFCASAFPVLAHPLSRSHWKHWAIKTSCTASLLTKPGTLLPGWRAALDAKQAGNPTMNWREVFDKLLVGNGYVGVSAMNAILFAEELVAAYPEAKCILIKRDYECWAHSWVFVLDQILGPEVDKLIRTALGDTPMAWFREALQTYGRGDTAATIKANYEIVYREHNAKIPSLVPKEKLLVYEMGGGWETLCIFLQKDVQGIDFPRLNEQKRLSEGFARFKEGGGKGSPIIL